MDYCLPRADDLPSFSIDFRCTPNLSNVLGIKDCRESDTCGRICYRQRDGRCAMGSGDPAYRPPV